MNTRITWAAALALALLPLGASAETWNLATDFSATKNPNGPWSLGWRDNPARPLTLYTDGQTRCGAPGELDPWDHYIQDYTPSVTRNPQDYPVPCDDLEYRPHRVAFHQGPQQQSVVRFTVPSDGFVTLSVRFEAIDAGSSTVHISHNGASLVSAGLDGLGRTADYSATITCRSGDVIDCAIDPISFYADRVQLDVLVLATDPTATSEGTWGRMKALYRR